jgi:hypothetical protein
MVVSRHLPLHREGLKWLVILALALATAMFFARPVAKASGPPRELSFLASAPQSPGGV